jgi:hypothetical protein
MKSTKQALKKRGRGRPRVNDPAETYADKSYIVTTFRMAKRAVAEADAIKLALGLSTRTAAVQYALGQVFRTLPKFSSRSEEEIRGILEQRLAELGVEA